jgi:hypothetical protein
MLGFEDPSATVEVLEWCLWAYHDLRDEAKVDFVPVPPPTLPV